MLSFFPRDVLDESWDLIESVSEGFPTYSFSRFNIADLSKFVVNYNLIYIISNHKCIIILMGLFFVAWWHAVLRTFTPFFHKLSGMGEIYISSKL